MKNCDDCGCRIYNQTCSNCNEELYIYENQGEFIARLSEEFLKKVEEQKRSRDEKIEIVF